MVSSTTIVLHAFNAQVCCRVKDIIEAFFDVRLKFYDKRKDYLLNKLTDELDKLDNRVRFILAVVNGELVVSNRKKMELLQELKKKGYKAFAPAAKVPELGGSVSSGGEENDSVDESKEDLDKGYDYLLSMKIWSLTLEKVQALTAERNTKKIELDELKGKKAEDLWLRDLDELEAALDAFEGSIEEGKVQEKAAQRKAFNASKAKSKGSKKGLSKAKGYGSDSDDGMDDDDDDLSDFEEKPKKKPIVAKKPPVAKVPAVTKAPAPAPKPVAATKAPQAVKATKAKPKAKDSDEDNDSDENDLVKAPAALKASKPAPARKAVESKASSSASAVIDLNSDDDETETKKAPISGKSDLLSRLQDRIKAADKPATKMKQTSIFEYVSDSSDAGVAIKPKPAASSKAALKPISESSAPAKSTTGVKRAKKPSEFEPLSPGDPVPIQAKKVRKVGSPPTVAAVKKSGNTKSRRLDDSDDEEVSGKAPVVTSPAKRPTRERKQLNYQAFLEDSDGDDLADSEASDDDSDA